MPEKSIFEKIADREIPGYIIWENDTHMAFLDIFPASYGHTLVVPKKNPGDNIFDLPKHEYTELWEASQHIAKMLQDKLGQKRIFVAVEGVDVPHVHIHLIPAVEGISMEDLKKKKASPEELQQLYDVIMR